MIVIATNNGNQFLGPLIKNLNDINCKLPIAVIDTNSTDPSFVDFVHQLPQNNPKLNLKTYTTPGKNYDTGAYVYAIQNLQAERYYFLHDSITIKTPIIFEEIDKKLIPGVVVALTIFGRDFYDNEEQRQFCRDNWGTTQFNPGIFGPMFSILRTDLEKAWLDLPKILPTNKNEQKAMERGWSVFCTKNNLKVISLENLNYKNISGDRFAHFKKFQPQR